jgi:hypothetical protein
MRLAPTGRMRKLEALSALLCAGLLWGCGQASQNDGAGGSGGGSATPTSGTGGRLSSGWEGPVCRDGQIGFGSCASQECLVIRCDPKTSGGVACVQSGVCPDSTDPHAGSGGEGGEGSPSDEGGEGGIGGEGGAAQTSLAGSANTGSCECTVCRQGYVSIGLCAEGCSFTRCDRETSGVSCVRSGPCPESVDPND